MELVVFIFRWVIRLVIILMVSSIFLGITFIFVLMVSEDDEGNRSVKTFFLNIASRLVDLVKLAVYIAVLFAFVWCCFFITQPPCVNLVKKADDGRYLLSDTSMVCDSNDSTAYYTVNSMSKTDSPGRFAHCIRCGRIYKLHTRWLNEKEKRLKQTTDEINSEIATGLLVDPL